MTIDEKYKKTLEEIEALKDHLGDYIASSINSFPVDFRQSVFLTISRLGF